MESEDLLHEFLRLGNELIGMRRDVLQFMNPWTLCYTLVLGKKLPNPPWCPPFTKKGKHFSSLWYHFPVVRQTKGGGEGF
jgi:hypothetical protein